MSEGSDRERFGRYETLFRIAGGGMAEVYAARALGEAGFQKLVALKRMKPALADDARFVTMFLDEGRVAANIASPNVVSTLDLGRADDNSLYLVMELVKGASLNRLLSEARRDDEPVPLPIAVDILAQAARGLHDAHEAVSPTGEPLRIVHRDCSPHNILIDVNGQVKITDFGIAKAMERQTVSRAGEMKGKLSYLSPEQARGRPVDRRVDVFILGIVAWEVFTGRRLFDADNPVEALHRVASAPIPPVASEAPGVPEALSAAVAKALERDPDERFGTALELGIALLEGLGEAPSHDRGAVGEWVRRYGGRDLRRLEEGIRRALSGAGPSEMPPPLSTPPTRENPRAAPSLPATRVSVEPDTDPVSAFESTAATTPQEMLEVLKRARRGDDARGTAEGVPDPADGPPDLPVTPSGRRRRTAVMGSAAKLAAVRPGAATAPLGSPAGPGEMPPPRTGPDTRPDHDPRDYHPTVPLDGPAAPRGKARTARLDEHERAPLQRAIATYRPPPPEAPSPPTPSSRRALWIGGAILVAVLAAVGLGGGAWLATVVLDQEARLQEGAATASTPPEPQREAEAPQPGGDAAARDPVAATTTSDAPGAEAQAAGQPGGATESPTAAPEATEPVPAGRAGGRRRGRSGRRSAEASSSTPARTTTPGTSDPPSTSPTSSPSREATAVRPGGDRAELFERLPELRRDPPSQPSSPTSP